ncbi:hypothetical protein OROMI_017547 [Orobanche minor]
MHEPKGVYDATKLESFYVSALPGSGPSMDLLFRLVTPSDSVDPPSSS